ncbi:hypothetical protein GWK91_03370 [Virgibacillus sp. MSP4-1]|uniref:hypothetical protein n=1 Tax=Virgibacillus sp. MSP4-1 TaxID=2700081 RepID=UPI0003A77417|nr:hypothetical protein [Virgibacillus sp. MSP4-1]QHS22043.1 hypothetical protein GWK91_03370 [Virgibacillus sp. MSP4-1]
MKKWLLFLLMALIFIGCSDDNEESQVKETSDQEEMTEETEDKEKALPETLTIPVTGTEDSITIHLENAPLLGRYMAASGKQAKEMASSFKARHLTDEAGGGLYMMSYACQGDNRRCSYLLIQKGEEENTVPLTDLAVFVSYQLSPDMEKIMLFFERGQNDTKTHDIQVVDLTEHKLLSLQNEDLTEEVLNYNYPIEAMEWADTDTIKVRVPSHVNLENSSHNLGEEFILFEVT